MGRTTSKTSTTSVTLTDLTKALALLGIEVETPASVSAPVEEAPVETARQKKAREKREQKARDEKAAAAEARKNAFYSTIKDPARKSANAVLAAWMRAKGVTPNGPAWKAATVAENGKPVVSDIEVLRALNVAAEVKAPSEAQMKAAAEKFRELTGKDVDES